MQDSCCGSSNANTLLFAYCIKPVGQAEQGAHAFCYIVGRSDEGIKQHHPSYMHNTVGGMILLEACLCTP